VGIALSVTPDHPFGHDFTALKYKAAAPLPFVVSGAPGKEMSRQKM